MKKTKIVATVGPVTNSRKRLKELYNNGINVIRFNFSHAKQEDVLETVKMINELNESQETNLSLLLDTKGPEIRTGDLSQKNNYKKGDVFEIFVDPKHILTGLDLFCDYEYLVEDLKVGKIIIIESGIFNVKVIEKKKNSLKVKALNSGLIGSRRHINLPGVRLKLPGITEKDVSDITFAIKNNFAFIAASFIRSGENVKEIRELFKKHGNEKLKIISKIENQEGIENIDSIIDESDGIMVARGDLGIEVPIEKLAVYQRMIVEKCKAKGKFVIVATDLLASMIENPFPTRAETSDVYNAVMQGADSLMLSGETAMGKFPIESVAMMTKIIKEAEKNIKHTHEDYSAKGLSKRDIEKKALIRGSIFVGEELKANAIVLLTKSGMLAKLASSFRPNITVYAFTNIKETVKTTNILYSIKPMFLEGWNKENYNGNLELAINILKEKNILKSGNKIIAINDIQKDGNEIPVMEIIEI